MRKLSLESLAQRPMRSLSSPRKLGPLPRAATELTPLVTTPELGPKLGPELGPKLGPELVPSHATEAAALTPTVPTAQSVSPQAGPSRATDARPSLAPLPPLFTLLQLQQAHDGLHQLALPLLRYLDPEDKYNIVDSLSGEPEHHYQHLVFQALATSTSLDQYHLQVNQYWYHQNRCPHLTWHQRHAKKHLFLPRWARVPRNCQNQDPNLDFSSTPKRLGHNPMPAFPQGPQAERLKRPARYPTTPLTTPLGPALLEPDTNLLLEVLGLLSQHTGYCAIPICANADEGAPYYRCLTLAEQAFSSAFALFYLSEDCTNLNLSQSQRYRQLYLEALNLEPSTISAALRERSAERIFITLQQQTQAPNEGLHPVPPHADLSADLPLYLKQLEQDGASAISQREQAAALRRQERTRGTRHANALSAYNYAGYECAEYDRAAYEYGANARATAHRPYCGAAQELITHFPQWPYWLQQLRHHQYRLWELEPSLDLSLMVGALQRPWRGHEQIKAQTHLHQAMPGAEDERLMQAYTQTAARHQDELICDYLSTGLSRLCCAPSRAILADLKRYQMPVEIVVDGTQLVRAYQAGMLRQILQRFQPYPEPLIVTWNGCFPASTQLPDYTPKLRSALKVMESLRHHPANLNHCLEHLALTGSAAADTYLARVGPHRPIGGTYCGQAVKLYALPQRTHAHSNSPTDAAPSGLSPQYLAHLVNAEERLRTADYWHGPALRGDLNLAQLTVPQCYPKLFSHQGKAWLNSVFDILLKLRRPHTFKERNLSYDGSEQTRRALTCQLARDYCLEQSLTYCAGDALRVAQLAAAPRCLWREYLSEAARTHPITLPLELIAPARHPKQVLTAAQVELKLMIQVGLNRTQCHYYLGSSQLHYDLMAQQLKQEQKPTPRAVRSAEQSITRNTANSNARRATRRSARGAANSTTGRAESNAAQSAASNADRAPFDPLPHLKGSSILFPNMALITQLNRPELTQALTALVEHYYQELETQGLLYREQVRLPLVPASLGLKKIPPEALRLVLTALSARPDLHFCYARLGHPFVIDPRVRLNQSCARSHLVRPSLRTLTKSYGARPPQAQGKWATLSWESWGQASDSQRPAPSALGFRNLEQLNEYVLACYEQETNFCDLTLYFSKPRTHEQCLRQLNPHLTHYAHQHPPRRTPSTGSSTAPKAPQSRRRARKSALAPQACDLQLPSWSSTQLTRVTDVAHLEQPLTFAQSYVLQHLLHGNTLSTTKTKSQGPAQAQAQTQAQAQAQAQGPAPVSSAPPHAPTTAQASAQATAPNPERPATAPGGASATPAGSASAGSEMQFITPPPPLSNKAVYPGQINFFLAAGVYQSLRQLNHLSTQTPLTGARTQACAQPSPVLSKVRTRSKHKDRALRESALFDLQQDLQQDQARKRPAPTALSQPPSYFPTFAQFLYALEALECQQALMVQCLCEHCSLVFNPQLSLQDAPAQRQLEQKCPSCHANLLL